MCTELYLLARGVGSGMYEVDEMVILVLLTLQTTWLMVHLSLAAGTVQEQVINQFIISNTFAFLIFTHLRAHCSSGPPPASSQSSLLYLVLMLDQRI